MAKRRTPWTPIFNPDPRYGAVAVGSTPGSPNVCVPTLTLVTGKAYAGAATDTHPEIGQVMAANSTHLFVTSWFNLFNVYDITTDPADPTLVGSITGDTDFDRDHGLFYEGDYCYVSCSTNNNMIVVDVSDPTSPTKVGVANDQAGAADLSSPKGIWKVGDYVYCAGFRFVSIDVSTPASPTVDTALAGYTNFNGIWYDSASGYVYATRSIVDGIVVIDVTTTPGTPTFVAEFTDASLINPQSIRKYGDYIFCGNDADDDLMIIDASTPASLSFVASYSTTNTQGALGMWNEGDYLYLGANDSNGVVALDISNPASISEVDFVTDPVDDFLFDACDAVKVGQYLYVAAYQLAVVDTGCP